MIPYEARRLPGLLLLKPTVHRDARGFLVKSYQESWFEELSLPTAWPERFYSRSGRGVIRGLHFQEPPADHDKLVYCAAGHSLDVVVDLRLGSPTYGEFEMIELDEEAWIIVFIPSGLAHGFAAVSDSVLMAYATTTVYDPDREGGIRWDSVGIPWSDSDPILSTRDLALPAFADYQSRFTYRG